MTKQEQLRNVIRGLNGREEHDITHLMYNGTLDESGARKAAKATGIPISCHVTQEGRMLIRLKANNPLKGHRWHTTARIYSDTELLAAVHLEHCSVDDFRGGDPNLESPEHQHWKSWQLMMARGMCDMDEVTELGLEHVRWDNASLLETDK